MNYYFILIVMMSILWVLRLNILSNNNIKYKIDVDF